MKFEVVIRATYIFLLLSGLLISGCTTATRASPSDIHQLQNVKIVRVATPPLTKNTWAGSLVKVYPSLLTAAINDGSAKPEGLLPPGIPDFGAILATRLKQRLAEKAWWPSTDLMEEPIASADKLPSGNSLLVQLEGLRISGGGQFVAVARFKLFENGRRVLWDTRGAYNGVFSSQGDNIDARLLKGQSSVEEEFNHAANYIIQTVLEVMP